MGDKSISDDETNNSPSGPEKGGKKLKLNDGSSQESPKESDMDLQPSTSEVGNEVISNFISSAKSENIDMDEPAAASEGPSNVVIEAVASSSMGHSVLLKFKRQNLRKRKSPEDSDSNSSKDSDDDVSLEQNEQQSEAVENSTSDLESEDMVTDGTPSVYDGDDPRDFFGGIVTTGSNDSSSDNNSNSSFDSNNLINMDDETDSDEDGLWSQPGPNEDKDAKTPSVLLKTRPKHNYLILREVINREMGLTFPYDKATKNDVMFEQKFYGSLHAVYRLKKLHSLNKHRGCVNSINFHPEGHLLVSGSDDTNIIIWDWAKNIAKQTIKTGHKSNVFQSKFLYLNSSSQLNIVTCARDGVVYLLQVPAAGGAAHRRVLALHGAAAHKLHVSPLEPRHVLSCGEDGRVKLNDLRQEHSTVLFRVKDKNLKVPLYSVTGHPLDVNLIAVAGRDRYVRVYDRRQLAAPAALYCPNHLAQNAKPNCPIRDRVKLTMHLTCAVYNHDGTELLGSYNDDDIYLFNTKDDVFDRSNTNEEKEGFTHRYSGHRNNATFKGVSFFGPKSQYVVSGSDCSHIYIWEKETESIVQWMKGDKCGVVNCIEGHPWVPVLATSGLDRDVKLWAPRRHTDPDYSGMDQVVRKNNRSQLHSPLFNDFLPTLYSAMRGENRLFSDDEEGRFGGNIEFDGNVCTAM